MKRGVKAWAIKDPNVVMITTAWKTKKAAAKAAENSPLEVWRGNWKIVRVRITEIPPKKRKKK